MGKPEQFDLVLVVSDARSEAGVEFRRHLTAACKDPALYATGVERLHDARELHAITVKTAQ